MRAGAIQLNATDDTDRNLETADRLVRQAASQGAELIVLPETWTVLGSLFERGEDGVKGFNTSVHVGPDGELRAIYRKIHLFDVTVDEANYGEAATYDWGAA